MANVGVALRATAELCGELDLHNVAMHGGRNGFSDLITGLCDITSTLCSVVASHAVKLDCPQQSYAPLCGLNSLLPQALEYAVFEPSRVHPWSATPWEDIIERRFDGGAPEDAAAGDAGVAGKPAAKPAKSG
jgi:hypothetical protein